MPNDPLVQDLVDRIRRSEEGAWQECIDLYEGRLLAFARRRLKNAAAAEDIVQESFIGFLTALPNYDDRTPLESFLFAIASHKLTDYLRREGRRPTIALPGSDSTQPGAELRGRERVASSMARSHERKSAEEGVVAECLGDLISLWKEKGEWERLKCLELLLVRGRPNKEVAQRLGITEQTVANHKHFVVTKLKESGTRARLREFDLAELGVE